MKSIWILEDDKSAQFVYDETLSLKYKLSFLDSLEDFKSKISTHSSALPDLIIADLRLQDGSFLDHLNQSATIHEKILVISSNEDVDILRACYQKGIHDYLIKPFKKSELLVKLERVLKETHTYVIPDLRLQLENMRITYKNQSVTLTSKEAQIMALLLSSPTASAKKKVIYEKVWGTVSVGSKTLDVHLVNLRKKLSPFTIEIKLVGEEYQLYQEC